MDNFFDKIWHGDEPRPFRRTRQTKFNMAANRHLENLKIMIYQTEICIDFSKILVC